MAKRPRDPDEALKQTDKHPHLQKRRNISSPETSRSRRKVNEEKSGRPEPSSHAASQAQLPQPPPIQLPSQQPQLDNEWSDSETSTYYSKDAATYDVRRDAEIDGIPHAEDIELWGLDAAKFIRSHSGRDENWVGVRPLGQGANGIAGLWELRGHDGEIVEQMVVKEETYEKKYWKDHEDVRDVPAEVKVMSKLNKANCHAITRLIDYKRYPHVYKHRMYMEFCPHNDLDRLIKRYSGFRHFLPEAFLWDTFYHLVEAAVAMRSGTGDWDFEIIHRDLKPANVFLGAENAKKGFPFYPVAKVGDFGHAVMTNHEDARNQSGFPLGGTPGYIAPEDVAPKKPQHRLSAYTNIWNIGAIMLELLTLYRHADYMNDSKYNLGDGRIVDIETVKQPEYSQELRDLIKQCVEPNPLNRVKLKELRSRIKSGRLGCRKSYRDKGEGEGEKFEANYRLYYVKNEISEMSPGNWDPQRDLPPRSRSGEFFDREYPVHYPQFSDGPEDESNDEATLPSNDQEAKGHRLSKPILLSDDQDLANKSNDSSDIWRRKERRPPPPRLVQKDDSSSDGRRPLDRNLDVARGIGGVRDDDEGSDDEEVDMDLEVSEPPSPPPPPDKGSTSASTPQAEVRAVAHAAAQQVQTPNPPTAQVQTQAQAAPQVQAQPPAPPQTALQAVADAALAQPQAQAAPQVQVQVHAPAPPPPPPSAPAPAPQAPAPPPPPPAPAAPAPAVPRDLKRLRNGKVHGF